MGGLCEDADDRRLGAADGELGVVAVSGAGVQDAVGYPRRPVFVLVSDGDGDVDALSTSAAFSPMTWIAA